MIKLAKKYVFKIKTFSIIKVAQIKVKKVKSLFLEI